LVFKANQGAGFMQKKQVKENDLVTVTTNKYSNASNTYRVFKRIGNECILSHPLSPECFIVKPLDDLNNVPAILQNSTEKCLVFAKKNDRFLSHSVKADLEAMVFYFTIKKDFTIKQKSELASICGKITSVILQNNIMAACKLIIRHKVLLDDFHTTLYNTFEKVIKQPNLLKTKIERFTVFNLCGFIIAQLGEDYLNE
jgi:hypothetical protein